MTQVTEVTTCGQRSQEEAESPGWWEGGPQREEQLGLPSCLPPPLGNSFFVVTFYTTK